MRSANTGRRVFYAGNTMTRRFDNLAALQHFQLGAILHTRYGHFTWLKYKNGSITTSPKNHENHFYPLGDANLLSTFANMSINR